MASAPRTERLDMRVDADTKQLAERASAAAGYASLTDFVTHLIRENAPEILKQQTTIELSNQHFDQFMAACMGGDTAAPGPRILEAAKRLDQEGF
ncbi:MAG: DUF1778 domain-containing protein [Pseudomonadales bacterium]|nr:DUF1778 domain-containing protein [Pseudomonadales bacterium]